jgi:hypothetical protein
MPTTVTTLNTPYRNAVSALEAMCAMRYVENIRHQSYYPTKTEVLSAAEESLMTARSLVWSPSI